MDVVVGVVGLAVAMITLADAFDTLVSTRIRRGRQWPTDVFYRLTWRVWRFSAARPRGLRRQTLLSLYGPLSLVVLLGLWTFGQIIGWALSGGASVTGSRRCTRSSTPSTTRAWSTSRSASATRSSSTGHCGS